MPCCCRAVLIRCVRSARRATWASSRTSWCSRDEEEPIAAPRHVPRDVADAFDGDRHVRRQAIAGDVFQRHRVPSVVIERNAAHGRFEQVPARGDPSQVAQRDGDADRSVAAHAEIADVVEEDHAGDAGRILGRAQQRTDQHVGAARLADDRPPEVVVDGSKSLAPLGQGPRTKVGPAAVTTRVGSPPVCESMTWIRCISGPAAKDDERSRDE